MNASLIGFVAVVSLFALGSCGRSAPVDALSDLDGDPDIAGVSVTSADAVVAPVPLSLDEKLDPSAPTSEVPIQQADAQATHVVQSGDTLSGIAGQYGISIEAVAEFNNIVDVNSLSPGQELQIPSRPVEVTVVDTAESTTSQP